MHDQYPHPLSLNRLSLTRRSARALPLITMLLLAIGSVGFAQTVTPPTPATKTPKVEVKDARFSGKRTVMLKDLRLSDNLTMSLEGEINTARRHDLSAQVEEQLQSISVEFSIPIATNNPFTSETEGELSGGRAARARRHRRRWRGGGLDAARWAAHRDGRSVARSVAQRGARATSGDENRRVGSHFGRERAEEFAPLRHGGNALIGGHYCGAPARRTLPPSPLGAETVLFSRSRHAREGHGGALFFTPYSCLPRPLFFTAMSRSATSYIIISVARERPKANSQAACRTGFKAIPRFISRAAFNLIKKLDTLGQTEVILARNPDISRKREPI